MAKGYKGPGRRKGVRKRANDDDDDDDDDGNNNDIVVVIDDDDGEKLFDIKSTLNERPSFFGTTIFVSLSFFAGKEKKIRFFEKKSRKVFSVLSEISEPDFDRVIGSCCCNG